jgi:hypothetical protein
MVAELEGPIVVVLFSRGGKEGGKGIFLGV